MEVLQLVAFIANVDRRSPEPIEESTEDNEMSEATNRLPAPGRLLETAAVAALLLLRSIDREFKVELLVIFQELLILRM